MANSSSAGRWRRGIWACSSCNHHHPLRIRETTLTIDRHCLSCGRRCRRTLNRDHSGRGGRPTALLTWRPQHMPFHAIRAECKNRNAKVRAKRAAARALDHDQPLEEWGPESGFQTATRRVEGELRAITTDRHFHTNFIGKSERDHAVKTRRRMLGQDEDEEGSAASPDTAGEGDEE